MDRLLYFSVKHDKNELFKSGIKLKKNELSK